MPEEKREVEETAKKLSLKDSKPAQEEAASTKVYRQIATTIFPSSIKMNEDVPSAHQRGPLFFLET